MTSTSTPETTTARTVRQMPGKSAPKTARPPVVGKRDRTLMWGELVAEIDRADDQDITVERLRAWCDTAARAVVAARPHHTAKVSAAAQEGNRVAQERRVAWLRDSTTSGLGQLYRKQQRTSGMTGTTQAPSRRGELHRYDRAVLRSLVAGQV